MKNVTKKNSTTLLLASFIFLFWGCETYRKSNGSIRNQTNIDPVASTTSNKTNTNKNELTESKTNHSSLSANQNIPAATIEFAASSSTDIDSVYWFERIHSFGDVPSGPPASTKFYFINKGNKPISISDVQAGCSCTATEFTKGLISPNDTGYVSAAYKTANTFGFFRKHVDVFFDHKEKKHHLILTGNVDPMRSK
jgi:hypothetical protein